MKKLNWRIIAGLISAVYIVYMWAEKDIVSIYETMPEEQILPMVVTTVAVTVLKVAAVGAGIWGIKWLAEKFKK